MQCLEYYALRLVVVLLRALPRNVSLWLGKQAGTLARLLRVRRSTVRSNLAFVGYPPEAQRRIERALYPQMGRYMVDVIRGGKIACRVASSGDVHLSQPDETSNGTLLLFSHLGNWEQLLLFLTSKPFISPAVIVAKPMHNKLTNQWLERERSQRAPDVSFVPPQNALRQSIRSLRAGGIAAFAIDQYGGTTGLPARFLGQETSTVRSTAGLEMKTHCRVVGAYALLAEDNTYQIVLEELPPAPENASIPILLDRHNDLVSGWIRQHPEHWFGWFHRRFRDVLAYC